jgi:hypothetical protein
MVKLSDLDIIALDAPIFSEHSQIKMATVFRFNHLIISASEGNQTPNFLTSSPMIYLPSLYHFTQNKKNPEHSRIQGF